MHQHKNSIAMKWQKASVISYQRHVQNTETFFRLFGYSMWALTCQKFSR